MTRRQRYLRQALDDVEAMASRDEKTRAIYGGLCHKLPILIRTNGLCQALAFVEEKAKAKESGVRGDAYRAVRRHVAATLGIAETDLLRRVAEGSLADYQRQTRALLDASVYYKRFAASILKVEPGDLAAEEE